MSDLNKRLAEIQQGLHAGKDLKNGFGKYNYRSAEGIMQALKPLLGDCHVTLSDSIEHIGDRYYVKATATLTLGSQLTADNEISGRITPTPIQSISVSAFARECDSKKGMDDAQLTGSCSSYARKYALCGLFLIDDNKDIDEMDNKNNPSQSQFDLDVQSFGALFVKNDNAGIVGYWDDIKGDKNRAGPVYQALSPQIREILMQASK